MLARIDLCTSAIRGLLGIPVLSKKAGAKAERKLIALDEIGYFRDGRA
jgi:hypothetical protein